LFLFFKCIDDIVNANLHLAFFYALFNFFLHVDQTDIGRDYTRGKLDTKCCKKK